MPLRYIPESAINIFSMVAGYFTFLLSSFDKLNLEIPVEILGIEGDAVQLSSGILSLVLTGVLIKYRNAQALHKRAEALKIEADAKIKLEEARAMRLANDLAEFNNSKEMNNG